MTGVTQRRTSRRRPSMPAGWAPAPQRWPRRPATRRDLVPATVGAAGFGLAGLVVGLRLLAAWLAAPVASADAVVLAPLVALAVTGYGVVVGVLGGAAAAWSRRRAVRARPAPRLPLVAVGVATIAAPSLLVLAALPAPGAVWVALGAVWLAGFAGLDRTARRGMRFGATVAAPPSLLRGMTHPRPVARPAHR